MGQAFWAYINRPGHHQVNQAKGASRILGAKQLKGCVIPNFFGGLKLASSLLGWFGVPTHGDCEETPGDPMRAMTLCAPAVNLNDADNNHWPEYRYTP